MGQAAIDLPDSPDQAPAPLNSADDLLSQLAGAEIDRLLAEAGPETASGGDPALDAAFDLALAPTTEAEVDELIKAANDEAAALEIEAAAARAAIMADPPLAPAAVPATPPAPLPAPAAAAATPATTEAFNAEVDNLFKELNAVPPPPAPEPPAAEIETSAAELAALAAPVVEPEPEVHEEPAEPIRRYEKPSLLVRLLELVNWPFAACPDWLRETLGKIAILTLMNALAVMLYLIIFGRR
jgi:hypothetical protein